MATLLDHKKQIEVLQSRTARLSYFLENWSHIRTLDLRAKNSSYNGGALDTYGADVGHQINDKTQVTVGYYHQNGDATEADGGGVSAGLTHAITDNLTAGLKVSYDDAFETRVMATINWSFADLFKDSEAEKEATTTGATKALHASPEQRDVRVHDCAGMYNPTTGMCS